MSKKFVIGDIHGCLQTLERLLSIMEPKKSDEIFLLGDLVDRGPDSRGVIELILDLQAKGYAVQVVRGNHEQMLLDSIGNPETAEIWGQNGGGSTLQSYQAQVATDIDRKHLDFLNGLPYFLKTDNFWLVHAGFSGEIEDPLEDEHSMLWVRGFSVNKEWLGSAVIIHGHTPTPLEAIKMNLEFPESQVICLDGGCVFNYLEGMGHLVALELTRWKMYSQFCLD